MDFSRHAISTMQREVLNKFFRDRQLTQHIRELNISNLRVLNWQMDDQLEEFVLSICPHLEALHVLDCGIGLQRLHRILKKAPKLTALSWSLLDITSEDIQFLSESMKSSKDICLKNIKHLHLEIFIFVPEVHSFSHIQIAKYLLLSCFRDLEELEIYTWWKRMEWCTGWDTSLPTDQFIPCFPQQSVENELHHLHRLMVAAVGDQLFPVLHDFSTKELFDFVTSVLSRKSSSTKWKKFWIFPTIESYSVDRLFENLLINLLQKVNSDDFQSVEEITANPGWSLHTVDELKTFFERIGDNTIRSLHLCLPYDCDSMAEICDPILRVGGHSLKFLRLSANPVARIHAEQNVVLHRLLAICSNIVELDLLCCGFDKDICEPLSELKHLAKVQLSECAISSKYDENEVEMSKANLLTLVENCKNITHLDVRGCWCFHGNLSCRLADDDLLALTKLRNLKSLTLYEISGITDWTFLKKISQHCKFLTMLRISAREHFNNSHIPILMESAKFLKHLAIRVNVPVLESEIFWNLLSHAKNLQRLCIKSICWESLNVPVVVETLKSLPQLYVLHLHSYDKENVEDFYDQMIRMLEERESDCRFSFEIVTENQTWPIDQINHQTGYTLISNKALPLNLIELCDMTRILDIPIS